MIFIKEWKQVSPLVKPLLWPVAFKTRDVIGSICRAKQYFIEPYLLFSLEKVEYKHYIGSNIPFTFFKLLQKAMNDTYSNRLGPSCLKEISWPEARACVCIHPSLVKHATKRLEEDW